MLITGDFVVYCYKCQRQLKVRVDYDVNSGGDLQINWKSFDKHLQHGWLREFGPLYQMRVVCPYHKNSAGGEEMRKRVEQGSYPPGVPKTKG